MIGFYNYTVVATYFGLASGVAGIYFAMSGRLTHAIFALAIAGFFDMFDGKIARTRERTEDEKAFGIQIDSLSDLVAFGVLPASIGFGLCGEGPYGILMVIYVLNALIRLGYYNVTEANRQKETSEARHIYEGLPVTASAAAFPMLWCFKPLIGSKFSAVYAALMMLIAVLFITPFHIPKPKGKALGVIVAIGIVFATVLTMQWMAGRI